MNTKDKDFARYYISYQDNLSESDKITLLNFVKESSDLQVTALLYLGEMYEQHEVTDMVIENPGIFLHEVANFTDAEKIAQFGAKLKRMLSGAGVKATDSAALKSAKLKTYMMQHQPGTWSYVRKHPKLRSLFDKALNNVSNLPTPASTQDVAAGVIKKKAAMAGAVGGAGAVVIAAAIAAAAYKIYKRFISQAAKACKGRSGADKTLCMSQHKKKALQARIKNMQSSMKQCDQTKDPTKCKAKTMQTIKHLQSKM